MISRACLLKARERLASTAFLRCMMFLNCEWPAIDGGSRARPGQTSALAELEAAPRLALAVLLALDHAAVAGQEPAAAQHLVQGGIALEQRARQAQAHRAALSRGAAAEHVDPDVPLLAYVRGVQRRAGVIALLLDREVALEGPAVHQDLACALGHAHARDRRFAAAGGPDELLPRLGHAQRSLLL